MTFYNHIENIRTMAINLTHGEPWHGARDKARVFDSLDAARREYMRLSDENGKLRELCEDMLSCIQIRAEFSRPPTMEMYEMFYKRAYQLEVDKC